MYIGQEIVCVKDHSQNAVTKGQSYIIKDIYTYPCCGSIGLDVGIRSLGLINCATCNKSHEVSNIWWIRSELFIPVDYSQAKQVTFKEIEEPIFAN